MEQAKFENVLNFYYKAIKLKGVERTGWNLRNITRDERVESIPEHIYGAQQLAFAIYSEFDLNVDIFKVIFLLAFHETEETDIGDLNPFSGVSASEKAELGSMAVEKTLYNMKKREFMTALINEFNEQKTPEAVLAHLCDKMDADLMVHKYENDGRFSFDKLPSKILNDKKVQEIMREKNITTVEDLFLEEDIPLYSENEIFSDLIRFLKKYKIPE